MNAGTTGIQQIDFTIAFTDGSLNLPGPVTTLASFRANFDEISNGSANDNFESASSPWTVTGTATTFPDIYQWERREISPVEHRWADTNSNLVADQSLVSPPMHVGTGNFSFSFEHRYFFEVQSSPAGFFDGMVLEISTDNGATWTDIGASATPTYDHVLFTPDDNPLAGRSAYDGLSANYPSFIPVTVNLGTQYANQDVRIRFRVGTDSFGFGTGVEVRNFTTSGLTNTPFTAIVPQTVGCSAAGSVAATAGTPQSAVIISAFATQLQVTVKDASNNPVSGATVTFTAPSSGPSGTFAGGQTTATATTNAQGVATAPVFTANSVAGSYTVTATVAGVTTPANFLLTNLAGAAASVTATAGSSQSAVINTAFATRLQATVKDAGNNPVPDATVIFTAPSSGASGTFAGGQTTATAITNSQGVATAPAFSANSIAGTYTVTASVSGVGTAANFSLINLTSAAASIVATAGSSQSAVINTAFATQLQAAVKDAGNNAVSNAAVTFIAPSSGPSGTFAGGQTTATVTTTAQGVATAPVFTANSTAGSYAVTATVAGVATPASFSLTNTAADFTIASTAVATPVQVQAGGKAVINISISSGFQAPITFACVNGIPTKSQCVFPNGTAAPAGATSFEIDVQTTANTAWLERRSDRLRGIYALWLSFPSLLVAGLCLTRRKRRNAKFAAGISGILFVLLLLLSGCGGGASSPVPNGTPPGIYNITVSATSGAIQHQITVMIQVK
jgi:hypothetical protein